MEKPNHYQLTDTWVLKLLIFGHSTVFLSGIILLGFVESLKFSIIAVLFSFFNYYSIQRVLGFQVKNKSRVSRKLYDSAVFFFWAFFIFSGILFLFGGWILIYKCGLSTSSFLPLAFFASPFAGALGASKAWRTRAEFE